MKVAVHIVFWMLSFFISHRLLNVDYGESNINYYYTLLFHLPLIIGFYLITIVITSLLSKQRLWLIPILFVVGVGVSCGLHYLFFDKLSDAIFKGYYMASFFTWAELIQVSSLYLAIAVLLHLAFNRFELQEQKTNVMQEKNLIQMKALESKIQPHFLFNSLNNIYSSIDTSNTKARDYLIKLSDSMRYMIYDIDEESVPLSEEVNYLRNYIELEKLRFDQKDEISYDFENAEAPCMIAPLILIPLVENCFKHVDRNYPFINISLIVENDQLLLKTNNNIDESQKSSDKSGVGLGTLKSRLALLYPGKFDFVSKLKDGKYFSELKLDLSK